MTIVNDRMKMKELQVIAKEMGINSFGMKKDDLYKTIWVAQQAQLDAEREAKVAEITKEGAKESLILDTKDIAEAVKIVQAAFPTNKSDQIRCLLTNGFSKADIARATKTHYSYVHTVSKQWELKGGKAAVTTEKAPSISEQIRNLYDKGWDRASISKKLNINYSFVHNVLKTYKLKKGE